MLAGYCPFPLFQKPGAQRQMRRSRQAPSFLRLLGDQGHRPCLGHSLRCPLASPSSRTPGSGPEVTPGSSPPPIHARDMGVLLESPSAFSTTNQRAPFLPIRTVPFGETNQGAGAGTAVYISRLLWGCGGALRCSTAAGFPQLEQKR